MVTKNGKSSNKWGEQFGMYFQWWCECCFCLSFLFFSQQHIFFCSFGLSCSIGVISFLCGFAEQEGVIISQLLLIFPNRLHKNLILLCIFKKWLFVGFLSKRDDIGEKQKEIVNKNQLNNNLMEERRVIVKN